jgi:hypothetical protein
MSTLRPQAAPAALQAAFHRNAGSVVGTDAARLDVFASRGGGFCMLARLVYTTWPQVAGQVEPVMVYGHVFWNADLQPFVPR